VNFSCGCIKTRQSYLMGCDEAREMNRRRRALNAEMARVLAICEDADMDQQLIDNERESALLVDRFKRHFNAKYNAIKAS
jgi:hypothetical protein